MATDIDREEILANFQVCTGIEDIGECIAHLEQTEWDLQQAVNVVFDSSRGTTPQTLNNSFHPQFSETEDLSVSGHSTAVGPSTATPTVEQLSPILNSRDIHFSIEYDNKILPIVLPDTSDVGAIKRSIECELNIPVDKQELQGWELGKEPTSDDIRLSSLFLPRENFLLLLTPNLHSPTAKEVKSMQTNGEDTVLMDRLSQQFRLMVTDNDTGREFTLNFQGSKTVGEVKQDMFSLISVPVRMQQWSGWPKEASADDMVTLAGSGIGYPCHQLTVKRKSVHAIDEVVVDGPVASESEDECSNNCDISMDEDMFASDKEMFPRKMEPLIPKNNEDDYQATIHFSKEFSQRYGGSHPIFFVGKMEEAVKEAFGGKTKDRKLLAIYLHNDNSVLSNVFCSQLLCSETVSLYLTENFVTWGWDFTIDKNKAKFMDWCSNQFGAVTASTLRNFKEDQFPLLLLAMRVRSNTEVYAILPGSTTLDELMSSIMNAVDVFADRKISEMREESEREERERTKQEQDAAYQESLAADRAKAEARHAEETERIRQQAETQRKQELEEFEKQQIKAEKEAIRQSMEMTLPDEPPVGVSKPVSTLRFRLPNGDTVVRRFLAQESLQVLLNFVASKGFSTEEYKVLTTWPKRDLSSTDCSKTLRELELFPQETLFVEER